MVPKGHNYPPYPSLWPIPPSFIFHKLSYSPLLSFALENHLLSEFLSIWSPCLSIFWAFPSPIMVLSLPNYFQTIFSNWFPNLVTWGTEIGLLHNGTYFKLNIQVLIHIGENCTFHEAFADFYLFLLFCCSNLLRKSNFDLIFLNVLPAAPNFVMNRSNIRFFAFFMRYSIPLPLPLREWSKWWEGVIAPLSGCPKRSHTCDLFEI